VPIGPGTTVRVANVMTLRFLAPLADASRSDVTMIGEDGGFR
jgi:hypothetical protein